MANDEDLARLRQGVVAWNAWRAQNPDRCVDLSRADLSSTYLGAGWPLSKDYPGANLSGADLHGANCYGADLLEADLSQADLRGANLSGAQLWEANLRDADLYGMDLSRANLVGADLSRADLHGANLSQADLYGAVLIFANLSFANLSGAHVIKAHLYEADLHGANLSGAVFGGTDFIKADISGANLTEANLTFANLTEANLTFANLTEANLNSTILIKANLTDADLTGCRVYGISTWNLKLDGAKQRDLVITEYGQPQVTVDNVEVAQFIYLLLHNEKIRSIIDTITSKVVLILGRFTPERKAVLDALRDILHGHDRTPIVFDFDVPSTKNVTDTVKLLAQLARYIIVDLSDPNSAPYELGVISMLGLDSTPVVPLIVSGHPPFPMLSDVLQKPWSTELITYQDRDDLITNLGEKFLKPAEAKLRELRG